MKITYATSVRLEKLTLLLLLSPGDAMLNSNSENGVLEGRWLFKIEDLLFFLKNIITNNIKINTEYY